MKKKLLLSLALGLALTLLLGGTGYAGTSENPCPKCGDVDRGYMYQGSDGRHSLICLFCVYFDEYGTPCSGGTATCTSEPICEFCGRKYGAPLGHDWSAPAWNWAQDYSTATATFICANANHPQTENATVSSVTTAATACGTNGKITYTAKVTFENQEYTDTKTVLTSAKAHWYGAWTQSGDGTHSAACLRSGCKHTKTQNCETLEATVNGETLRVCPVCGTSGGKAFAPIDAVLTALDADAEKMRGEPVAFGLTAPLDGALYAFTVAYEWAGQTSAFEGLERISLPVEITGSFRLVRVDGTMDAKTGERAEAFTEILYTYANGTLTFESDVAGLFMILPVK